MSAKINISFLKRRTLQGQVLFPPSPHSRYIHLWFQEVEFTSVHLRCIVCITSWFTTNSVRNVIKILRLPAASQSILLGYIQWASGWQEVLCIYNVFSSQSPLVYSSLPASPVRPCIIFSMVNDVWTVSSSSQSAAAGTSTTYSDTQ